MKLKLPSGLVVAGVLALGVGLFMFLQPGVTVCSAQLEVFKVAMKGKFYSADVDGKKMPAAFDNAIVRCREGNSRGACAPFFQLLRELESQTELFPLHCRQELRGGDIDRLYQKAIAMILQVSWGDFPIKAGHFGWFQDPELSAYCRIRKQYFTIHTPHSAAEHLTKILKQLPGVASAKDPFRCDDCTEQELESQFVSVERARSRSLLALRCP